MVNLTKLFEQADTQNFWADRTDKELLELNLTTTDPEGLDGIRCDTPPEAGVYVEMGYDMTGRPEGKVRCVYCKYENHFHGVVVRDEGGNRYLVGRDCALSKYGVVYEALVGAFDHAVARQEALRRKQKLFELRKKIFAEFKDLRDDPAVVAFDNARAAIAFEIGTERWNELSRVIRDGNGILRYAEKVRDREAEERRVEEQPEPLRSRLRKAKGLGGLMPIFKEVERLGCRLYGDAFFTYGPSMAVAIAEIERDLRASINVLVDGSVSTRAMNLAFKALHDVLGRIESELERLRSAKEFFDEENLMHMAAWCRLREKAWNRFEARGRTLVVEEGRRRTSISLPDAYRVPGAGLVAVLREAVVLQPTKPA